MDFELRAYIADRRAELKERRQAATKRASVWAVDCALHELDRLEGWLNIFGRHALGRQGASEAAEHATGRAVLELEQ